MCNVKFTNDDVYRKLTCYHGGTATLIQTFYLKFILVRVCQDFQLFT